MAQIIKYFIDIDGQRIYDGNAPYIHWFADKQSTNLIYVEKLCFAVPKTSISNITITMPENEIFHLLESPSNWNDNIEIDHFSYNDIEKHMLSNDIAHRLSNMDYTIVNDKCIVMIYVAASSIAAIEAEQSIYLNDIVNTYKCDEIIIGADFYDEHEEHQINIANNGIEIPESIQRAIYDSNVHEEAKDNILMNRKYKELLMDYIDILGTKGSYSSLINSLKWFGYGSNTEIREFWKHKISDIDRFEGHTISSLINNKLSNMLNQYTKTTYYGLYCANQYETGNYVDDSNRHLAAGVNMNLLRGADKYGTIYLTDDTREDNLIHLIDDMEVIFPDVTSKYTLSFDVISNEKASVYIYKIWIKFFDADHNYIDDDKCVYIDTAVSRDRSANEYLTFDVPEGCIGASIGIQHLGTSKYTKPPIDWGDLDEDEEEEDEVQPQSADEVLISHFTHFKIEQGAEATEWCYTMGEGFLNEPIPELQNAALKWSKNDMSIKMALLNNFFGTYFMPIHLDLIHSTIEDIVYTNAIKIDSYDSKMNRDDFVINDQAISCSIDDGQIFPLKNIDVNANNKTYFANKYNDNDSYDDHVIVGVNDSSVEGQAKYDEALSYHNLLDDDEALIGSDFLYAGNQSNLTTDATIDKVVGIIDSKKALNYDAMQIMNINGAVSLSEVWDSAMPADIADKYLWIWTKRLYNDGVTTHNCVIDTQSNKSIASCEVLYAYSASPITDSQDIINLTWKTYDQLFPNKYYLNRFDIDGYVFSKTMIWYQYDDRTEVASSYITCRTNDKNAYYLGMEEYYSEGTDSIYSSTDEWDKSLPIYDNGFFDNVSYPIGWNKTIFHDSKGNTTTTYTKFGKYDDNNPIIKIENLYAVSNNQYERPEGQWINEPQNLDFDSSIDSFIWKHIVVTYEDGTKQHTYNIIGSLSPSKPTILSKKIFTGAGGIIYNINCIENQGFGADEIAGIISTVPNDISFNISKGKAYVLSLHRHIPTNFRDNVNDDVEVNIFTSDNRLIYTSSDFNDDGWCHIYLNPFTLNNNIWNGHDQLDVKVEIKLKNGITSSLASYLFDLFYDDKLNDIYELSTGSISENIRYNYDDYDNPPVQILCGAADDTISDDLITVTCMHIVEGYVPQIKQGIVDINDLNKYQNAIIDSVDTVYTPKINNLPPTSASVWSGTVPSGTYWKGIMIGCTLHNESPIYTVRNIEENVAHLFNENLFNFPDISGGSYLNTSLKSYALTTDIPNISNHNIIVFDAGDDSKYVYTISVTGHITEAAKAKGIKLRLIMYTEDWSHQKNAYIDTTYDSTMSVTIDLRSTDASWANDMHESQLNIHWGIYQDNWDEGYDGTIRNMSTNSVVGYLSGNNGNAYGPNTLPIEYQSYVRNIKLEASMNATPWNYGNDDLQNHVVNTLTLAEYDALFPAYNDSIKYYYAQSKLSDIVFGDNIELPDDEIKTIMLNTYRGLGAVIPFRFVIPAVKGDIIYKEELCMKNDDNSWVMRTFDNKFYATRDNIYDETQSYSIRIAFNLLCINDADYDVRVKFYSNNGQTYIKNIKFAVTNTGGAKIDLYKIKHKSLINIDIDDHRNINDYTTSHMKYSYNQHASLNELHSYYAQYLPIRKDNTGDIKLNEIIIMRAEWDGPDRHYTIEDMIDNELALYYYAHYNGKTFTNEHNMMRQFMILASKYVNADWIYDCKGDIDMMLDTTFKYIGKITLSEINSLKSTYESTTSLSILKRSIFGDILSAVANMTSDISSGKIINIFEVIYAWYYLCKNYTRYERVNNEHKYYIWVPNDYTIKDINPQGDQGYGTISTILARVAATDFDNGSISTNEDNHPGSGLNSVTSEMINDRFKSDDITNYNCKDLILRKEKIYIPEDHYLVPVKRSNITDLYVEPSNILAIIPDVKSLHHIDSYEWDFYNVSTRQHIKLNDYIGEGISISEPFVAGQNIQCLPNGYYDIIFRYKLSDKDELHEVVLKGAFIQIGNKIGGTNNIPLLPHRDINKPTNDQISISSYIIETYDNEYKIVEPGTKYDNEESNDVINDASQGAQGGTQGPPPPSTPDNPIEPPQPPQPPWNWPFTTFR